MAFPTLRLYALACAAASTLALAACSATPPSPAPAGGWAPFLQAYRWQLDTATDPRQQPIDALAPRADRPLVIIFQPEGRFGLRGGCNQLGGSYQLGASGNLAVPQLISTRMACEPALMRVDEAMTALLAQPIQLSLEPAPATGNTASANRTAPRLRLTMASQSSLVFTGLPTAETRFGGNATVMFLEVAPRRVACPHPMMPNARCLQVRERNYDAQGIAVGQPSGWQNLYENIEGYAHAEGVRNVLRVKRFKRPPPLPADASANVYVLDMVIETEAAPQ